MSAWVVDKACIDLLVEAVYRYEIPLAGDLTPDALGAMLWKENYRSINYLHKRRHRLPAYTHESGRIVLGNDATDYGSIKTAVRDPFLVFIQAACLRYQSCEHREWGTSLPCALIEALLAALCKSTGLTHDHMWAEVDARKNPWFIYYARENS